jgi:DNA-directed RNA polymerase specialized sigma24 family protein
MSPEPVYPPDLLDDDDEAMAAVCDAAVAVFADEVIGDLAARNLGWLCNGGELHLLASLTRHLQRRLPHAVAQSRGQGLTWSDISEVLGISASTVRRRSQRDTDATKGAPIDP